MLPQFRQKTVQRPTPPVSVIAAPRVGALPTRCFSEALSARPCRVLTTTRRRERVVPSCRFATMPINWPQMASRSPLVVAGLLTEPRFLGPSETSGKQGFCECGCTNGCNRYGGKRLRTVDVGGGNGPRFGSAGERVADVVGGRQADDSGGVGC